jgi:hypothetical protein
MADLPGAPRTAASDNHGLVNVCRSRNAQGSGRLERSRIGKPPRQIDKYVSNVLDSLPDEARVLIVGELQRRNPALLAELRTADEPTNEQSDGVVLGVLTPALRENFGPEYVPTEYGRAVERAIDAYLETWPISRQRR